MQHGQLYQLTIQGISATMESTTVSPNGAAGAAPTHTLASPAAEHMLDQILATPFAEADPPADLPPATEIEMPTGPDIEPKEPPAGDPFPELPPVPETDEPDTEPAAEPPAAEIAPPAAEAQPEPEAAAAEPASAEPSAEPNVDPQERLKTTITMEYQPNAFAIFRGKPVEITASHEGDTLFDGHYVTIDKTTGRIVEGTKIEKQPTAQLEPLRNATSLLRLRKGLILRAFDVLDGLLAAVGKEIEQVDACIETLNAAKSAIRDILPSKGKDLVF